MMMTVVVKGAASHCHHTRELSSVWMDGYYPGRLGMGLYLKTSQAKGGLEEKSNGESNGFKWSIRSRE